MPGGSDALSEDATGSSESAPKLLEFGFHFAGQTVDEDEWSDFTEDNRRQYASLPRNLHMPLNCPVIPPFTAGEVNVQESEQRDCAGDGIDMGQGQGQNQNQEEDLASPICPWQNKLEAHTDGDQQPEQEQEVLEKPSEAKRQIYIPPALRQSQGDFNRPKVEPRPRKALSTFPSKPQAPDLNSPEYFPSLGGSNMLKRSK
ncbi:hypothetical protein KR009_003409 [Drosophila setifemur]|nr:hypothetical protein KR009_003409 [Drosophila setifemur]